MQVSPRRTLLVGAVAATLALAGCAAPGAPADEEPLRYAVEVPDHLIPGNHFSSYAILFSLFAPLTTISDDGEIGYVAAESVESDDAVTWTITLREGWTFHDGEAVTAQSYVDAWNYAAYGPNAWVNGAQLRNVVGYDAMNPGEGAEPTAETLAGLTVVDDLTFTVELVGPDRQFPLQLSDGQTALYPLPSSAYEDFDAFDAHPIGNGPFRLEGDVVPNEPIAAVAYEDYPGETPTIDEVTFVPYIDTATAYTDALAGEVDIVAIGFGQGAQALTDFGDNFYQLDAPGVDFLGFPPDDPRFEDVRVRQAISMAIDRDAINEAVFGGSQIPATSLTSPSMPGDPAGVCGEFCEYDPEAARALLEEAGGFEGTLELLYIANWGQDEMFTAIANQLRQNLGIEDVTATAAPDFADFVNRVETGTAQGPFRARWGALYPSQQNTLQAVYTAAGEGNFGAGGYSNPEVDAALRAADAADTLEESYEGYRAVQELILADFPTVPLFGNRYLYVTSDRVAELSTISGGVALSRVVLAD